MLTAKTKPKAVTVEAGERADGDIAMQIMWNRLIAVVEEQAQVLLRTAFSPIVREAGDLSAGIFDRDGRMLAQAVTGTPGHVNSMAESVKHFIAHFGIENMRDGDAYITNDPWQGTGHTNDFVVTTPCFHNGELVGLFSCTSHLMDIGGIGFGPDATDVFMEGLHIPFLKLFDRGEANHTLFEMIRANTRLPVDTIGDVYSLANCNEMGCRYLREMMDEFALASLDSLADYIMFAVRGGGAGPHCRAAQRLVVLRDDGRWLRGADHAERHDDRSRTTASPSTMHRHQPGPAARRQRSAGLHDGLYGVRLWRARWHRTFPTMPARWRRSRSRRRKARCSTRKSPRPCWCVMSPAKCCLTWCSAVSARSFRIGCRRRAPRASGTSRCAAA